MDPQEQLVPHVTPRVLQGQPRFALPVHIVDQVLLHEQDIRYSKKNEKEDMRGDRSAAEHGSK